MRQDFRVLSIVATDATWADQISSTYLAGNYDGVHLRVQRGGRIANLDALLGLAGLHYLEVDGAVVDDTAAFAKESIKELILLTRCTAPIPRIDVTNVRRLGIDDRPGKENLSLFQSLQSLLIWSWQGSDLRFLSGLQKLTTLKIEGNGQALTLQGLESCSALEEIEIDGMRVTSLRPLAGLLRLRRIWVIGQSRIAGNVVLDLDDIAALGRLKELRLTFAGSVRSVRSLATMEALGDVRLRGTRIIDGDETALLNLAKRATVVRPGE